MCFKCECSERLGVFLLVAEISEVKSIDVGVWKAKGEDVTEDNTKFI